MTDPLVVVCVALVALLAFREWSGVRERREYRQQAADREAAMEAERRELYQRIQAPETAVLEHVREGRPERRKARPIAADDDAAFAAREAPERG